MPTKFNQKVTSAKTKCYFINNSNNKRFTCQFNPTAVPYEREAFFSTIDSPGISYPLTQYSGGKEREFDVELFMYDKPYTGNINTARKFFEALLPPEYNKSSFKKPPTFTFAYGYFVRTCVLRKLKVNDIWLNENGQPLETVFTLTLRQVGRT